MGEDPVAGAKRELLDESGLMSENLVLWHHSHLDMTFKRDSYIFLAKDCIQINSQKLDAGEKISILELEFEEFMDIVCSSKFRTIDLKIALTNKYGWRNGFAKIKEKIFELV